jgi:hypothetical protein
MRIFSGLMCKLVVLLLAVVVFSRTASAAITFDPTGSGGAGFVLTQMDWAAGNALAQGGANLALGDTFRLLSHARLSAFNNGTVPVPGGREFTYILGFPEVVTSFVDGPPAGPVGDTAIFGLAPGASWFEIYADAPPDSDDLTGAGHADGTLILSGSIMSATGNFSVTSIGEPLDTTTTDPLPNNDYPNHTTVSGLGASRLDVLVDIAFVNPLYFTGDVPGTVSFTTTNVTPFREVDPSDGFYTTPGGGFSTAIGAALGGGPGTIGPVNGGSPDFPDFQLQVDAASTFTPNVIPEPTAILVWGMMLVGCVIYRIRRR